MMIYLYRISYKGRYRGAGPGADVWADTTTFTTPTKDESKTVGAEIRACAPAIAKLQERWAWYGTKLGGNSNAQLTSAKREETNFEIKTFDVPLEPGDNLGSVTKWKTARQKYDKHESSDSSSCQSFHAYREDRKLSNIY